MRHQPALVDGVARDTAAEMIGVALQRNVTAAAVLAFRSMKDARFELALDATRKKQLSGAVIREGYFLDGGRLAMEGLLIEGTELAAQKKVLEVAEAAIDAGKMEDAGALLDMFLERFPSSNFLDYIPRLKARIPPAR